jgi:hypothetical protein
MHYFNEFVRFGWVIEVILINEFVLPYRNCPVIGFFYKKSQ